jgi:hypothetical protein
MKLDNRLKSLERKMPDADLVTMLLIRIATPVPGAPPHIEARIAKILPSVSAAGQTVDRHEEETEADFLVRAERVRASIHGPLRELQS